MTSLLDSGFTEDEIQHIVERSLGKYGKLVRRGAGMCGAVYFFDQGEQVHPRWVVAKIPRVPVGDRTERNWRFMREIAIQHRTYRHAFVCWPFDYQMILDTPAALYRASDGDLAQWIPRAEFSSVSRLAVLIYLCSALRHCRSRGVECHQDLKPQNILIADLSLRFRGLPAGGVFLFPQLADFGLANIGIEFDNAQGARPYMAPEQWLSNVATAASDIFALGVIIHEVMTQGMHPIGGVTREWWPEPIDGNSKKWLRPETWEKWAKADVPVVPATFLVDGVEHIARACLATKPEDRPTLKAIQADLLRILGEQSKEEERQAEFQAFRADNDPNGDEWPYRDHRLELLQRSVSERSC